MLVLLHQLASVHRQGSGFSVPLPTLVFGFALMVPSLTVVSHFSVELISFRCQLRGAEILFMCVLTYSECLWRFSSLLPVFS